VLRPDGETGHWLLDIELPPGDICFSTPPSFASTLYLVRLPESAGNAQVLVRMRLNQAPYPVHEKMLRVYRHDGIPPSVAGPWHDPANPGQGLYLTWTAKGIVATWTTYGADGKPRWLVGLEDARRGGDSNYVRRFRLSSMEEGRFAGASERRAPVAAVWGELEIEYLGCGRLRVAWLANDAVAFPPGNVEMRQFVQDATHYCDFEQYGRDNYTTIRYYDAVLQEGAQ
jgi:hypothetical protein